ncbi:hypothetical protein OFL47_24560, partial [Pseudomonas aeruginosa]|nr:hypothetical protein [Pseudomonas aeruginosa]
MTKRILHVVTNVAHYADPTQPTGLWLSELTHAYEIFAARGYQQRLVSPRGGGGPRGARGGGGGPAGRPPPPGPVWIQGEPTLLNELLSNLLDNA